MDKEYFGRYEYGKEKGGNDMTDLSKITTKEIITKLIDSENLLYNYRDLMIFVEDKRFNKEICKLIEAEKLVQEVRKTFESITDEEWDDMKKRAIA